MRGKCIATERGGDSQVEYGVLKKHTTWNVDNSSQVYRSSSGVEQDCPYPLGRLCQRENTGNQVYKYKYSGEGVTAYVIDEAVNVNHVEFRNAKGDRQRAVNGTKTCPGSASCKDHATHVAAIIGGRTYGVAKDIELVSIHAINCDSYTDVAYVVKALDWVLQYAKETCNSAYVFNIPWVITGT